MPASLKHLTDKKLNLTSLLARWKDGLYYTAAIVRCDKVNKKCLVCFEDGSEVWINNRDVHLQLSLDQLNEDEDIVCCVCDDGESEPPNEIILCDVCQQGYHQKCHNPPVDSSKIDESEDTSDHKDWFCATCSYILNQSNRAKLSANAQQHLQQQTTQQKEKPGTQQKAQKQELSPSKQPKAKPQQSQQQQQQQHLSQLHPQRQQSQRQQQQQQSSSPNKRQPSPTLPPTLSQAVRSAKIPRLSASLQTAPKSTVSPTKATVSPVQKPPPSYPLSNQARAVATSSTAALASMTASSALVVGSSAGRTKQDLVNQSNRSSQKQHRSLVNNTEPISNPVKHAVRKSSVNFVMPVRQSALPTATRSVLPNSVPPAKVPHHANVASSPTAALPPQQVMTQATLISVPTQSTVSSIESNTNNKNSDVKDNHPVPSRQPVAFNSKSIGSLIGDSALIPKVLHTSEKSSDALSTKEKSFFPSIPSTTTASICKASAKAGTYDTTVKSGANLMTSSSCQEGSSSHNNNNNTSKSSALSSDTPIINTSSDTPTS